MTASIAWPDSIAEMEVEVENQVAAPAETRTPNLHRAMETLIKSADGRVATVIARKGALSTGVASDKTTPCTYPTFLPSEMVGERSSPSRVRWRRTERALDRSGPL